MNTTDLELPRHRPESAEDKQLARMKRELSREVRQAMRRKGLSQSELARRMRTSRSTLFRLLRSELASMQLRSVARLLRALEGKITLRI